MVLWLGLHWSSIAELHHFLNISSVLEALNKFWIDRVYGSVKLETIYLLNYLNIFFPLCLLWLLCLGHSRYCTGLLIFFWKYLIFYEVSLRRRKTSERLSLIPFLSWQVQEWISSGNYRLRGQERVRAYVQNARLSLASCEDYWYPICKTDSFIRPNLYGMSLCSISNPTSVAISSHIPWRRHHYITTGPSEKNVHFVLKYTSWKHWNSVHKRDQQLSPCIPKKNCGQFPWPESELGAGGHWPATFPSFGAHRQSWELLPHRGKSEHPLLFV